MAVVEFEDLETSGFVTVCVSLTESTELTDGIVLVVGYQTNNSTAQGEMYYACIEMCIGHVSREKQSFQP